MKQLFQNIFRTRSLSRVAVYLSGLFLLLVVLGGQVFRDEKVLQQDIVQYYSYLPATFIYDDLSMSYARTSPFWQDKIWGYITPEGAYIPKYTMGLAIMYSPFFFAGHAHAHLTGAPTHGYSDPYELWLQIGAVFYVFLGMIFLRKLLLQHFSERVTAITLLTILFCTNLFYYTAAQGPMPHAQIFFLMSAFLFCTQKFHERPGIKWALLMALTGGMVVFVRPNHLLIWMIPVLYDFSKAKLVWWKQHWTKALVWIPGVLLVVSPQLFYWHHFSGQWIFYSYGEEGFFLDQPLLLENWFSFRKGWLIYTPVMSLALIGLFLIRRYADKWNIAFGVFFVATTYVIITWWCWWYGGTFGQRVYIDLFPMLAFGLAALLQYLSGKAALWWPTLALIGCFGLLNAFQTWQFTHGLLHYDSMTPQSYRALFGKTSLPENWEELIEHPDYDKAVKGER